MDVRGRGGTCGMCDGRVAGITAGGRLGAPSSLAIRSQAIQPLPKLIKAARMQQRRDVQSPTFPSRFKGCFLMSFLETLRA